MAQVEIPFVEQSLNSNDPIGSVIAIVVTILAMAAFYVGSHYGRQVADTVTQAAPDGQDSGPGFMGDL